MIEPSAYTILNVDDDEAGRYAKSRILKRAGYNVIESATGAAALKLVLSEQPQLVLLDVMLPDINGLDVCRSIKHDPSTAHIMILQVSATHVSEADRIEGLEGGADGYLTEPMEAEELLATVKALLRLYQREEENRRLVDQLRDADRRKNEFLATLSHELRNPLYPIRAAVEIMRLKDDLDPDIQFSRDVIDQQVNHLARLIDDLLDVARITRDKIELRRGKLRLVDVLNGALASSRTVIEAHGHSPTVALPAESVWIDGDTVRLTQIFVNLLSNAAKYTPKGGNIWLSAHAENDKAIVSVKDDGIGIANDQLPHVFEMFYQVDGSLERSQAGLGIGLTLTRRLVELHGGTIEARSDGPGKGSEFLVTLPAFIEQELAQPAEPPGGTRNENKANWRILVVDDGHNTREMYSVLLRRQGHEVDTAPDGKTGIEKIESFRPDAILLDVGMPGLNGFDTCERIRAQPFGKNVALIAVTGWAQEEVQQRAQAAGFDEVLVKPVGPQEILQSVGHILERKQAQ